MKTFQAPDLTEAFEHPAGYHSPVWLDLTGGPLIGAAVPAPLEAFVLEVAKIVRENKLPDCNIGVAYMRVIDGERPQNEMAWHVDNQDGGTRFSTAISTDDAKVNLAWAGDQNLAGQKVTHTDWHSEFQPDNGAIAVFTTEVHGVIPQPQRPGQLTAVFFSTLYKDRATADLYTTNCFDTDDGEASHTHAALPQLEGSR